MRKVVRGVPTEIIQVTTTFFIKGEALPTWLWKSLEGSETPHSVWFDLENSEVTDSGNITFDEWHLLEEEPDSDTTVTMDCVQLDFMPLPNVHRRKDYHDTSYMEYQFGMDGTDSLKPFMSKIVDIAKKYYKGEHSDYYANNSVFFYIAIYPEHTVYRDWEGVQEHDTEIYFIGEVDPFKLLEYEYVAKKRFFSPSDSKDLYQHLMNMYMVIG